MIQYKIALADLEQKVDAIDPKWRRKAKTRLARFKREKKYNEKSGIWNDLSPTSAVSTRNISYRGENRSALIMARTSMLKSRWSA
jgi:hypothetical protein